MTLIESLNLFDLLVLVDEEDYTDYTIYMYTWSVVGSSLLVVLYTCL